MRSMRFRLLTAAALGILLVLSMSWVALYISIRDSLFGEFDRLLGDKIRSLAALVEQDGANIELEFDEEGRLAEFRPSDHSEYYQAWLADGTVVGRSLSLNGGDLAPISGTEEAPAYRSVTLPDGRRGRAAGISFHPKKERDDKAGGVSLRPQRVTLVVARETADIDRTLAGLKVILVAVGTLATLGSLGVLALVVRSGLRPVDYIATHIRQVGENDLSVRIDLSRVPTELAPIGERLNDLLARLEAAFERERSFSADVSHELRTPLAGLRTTLEVALAGEGHPDAYAEAMTDCLAICYQTQSMVENLLSLARLESGQLEVERQSLNLDELLRGCWKPLEEKARARGLNVEWRVAEDLTLDSDREKLRLVFSNLFDNAVTHVDTGGRVGVEAVPGDHRVEVSIANTGSRLSPQEAERACERFWRGDASRKATGVHCGLGLCLCKKLVALLQGTLVLTSENGGNFRVVLTFPSRFPSDAQTETA